MVNRIVDVIRYLGVPLSARAIAANLGVSKTTVGRYARLWAERGLPHDKDSPEECSGRELYAHFNGDGRASSRVAPDFDGMAKRLDEPGMTLRRLHGEYAELAGDEALGYVQFTRRFASEVKTKGLVFRRKHPPGFVAFVDYSGKRPWYVNRQTGAKVPVELFVGVLGSSGLTFAQCSPSQTVPDWLDAHTNMLAFFGGTPKTVVPDNLKSAVISSGKDPTVQRHYLDWAKHNGTAVLPARPGQPRDKGQVEKAVLDVQRWLLPELARRKHFSVEQLNEHIAALMVGFNDRAFQKRDGSRRSEFERVERAALLPLRASAYEYAKWVTKTMVPADYHVPIYGHYYSVPHTLVGQKAEGRVSHQWVELFVDGERVARHARKSVRGDHTTDPAHQHEKHLAVEQRTPEDVLAWASKVGPAMTQIVERQFAGKIRLQGLPGALALRDLERQSTTDKLEAAAARAVARRVPNLTGVKRMLTELSAILEQEGRKAVPLGKRATRRGASPAASAKPAASGQRRRKRSPATPAIRRTAS